VQPLSSDFVQNLSALENSLDALENFCDLIFSETNASNRKTPLLDQPDKICFAGGREAYMDNKIQHFLFR
jgi:hypothetical protein